MAEEEAPFGALGDLVEDLVPLAARLVEAVRDEGPEAVRGVLLAVPRETRAQLEHMPGGVMGVFAVVLAGMVDHEATMRSLLGWATDLIDGQGAQRVIEDKIANAAAREKARLTAAGVRTAAAAEALAPPAGRAQATTKERMLTVIHGGRETA